MKTVSVGYKKKGIQIMTMSTPINRLDQPPAKQESETKIEDMVFQDVLREREQQNQQSQQHHQQKQTQYQMNLQNQIQMLKQEIENAKTSSTNTTQQPQPPPPPTVMTQQNIPTSLPPVAVLPQTTTQQAQPQPSLFQVQAAPPPQAKSDRTFMSTIKDVFNNVDYIFIAVTFLTVLVCFSSAIHKFLASKLESRSLGAYTLYAQAVVATLVLTIFSASRPSSHANADANKTKP